MEYLRAHCFPADEAIVAAWDSQVALAAEIPSLGRTLAERSPEVFSRFAASYARLRALPRGHRRALQRHLTRAGSLSHIPHSRRQKLARSLAGAALLLALAQGADAATIKVTTNIPDINDGDGKCSLIEAIVNANDGAATHPDCAGAEAGPNTIVLPKSKTIKLREINSHSPKVYGYSYPNGLPVITSRITIEANGAKITREKDAPSFRLIAVDESGDLTLNNVVLTGGDSSAGGGVFNYYGVVTIQNSIISGNSGSGVTNYGLLKIRATTISRNIAGEFAQGKYFAGVGGGITNYGNLFIQSSTISGNVALYAGGGVYNRYGTAVIIDSTISENRAFDAADEFGLGGGIYNVGTLTILQSTISANEANFGGGIYNSGAIVGPSYSIYTTLTMHRSLISGNKARNVPEIVNYYNLYANDFNLFGKDDDAGIYGFIPGPTDIVPSVPLGKIIGPLKNNGGLTKTHALVKGGPAVDAAPSDAECPAIDQRGVSRPRGAGCDIGAVER